MKLLIYLLEMAIEFYMMIILLRIWMQLTCYTFYNPFAQFVMKITQPIVGLLHDILPTLGPIDGASIIVAFALSIIKVIMLFMILTFQPIIWIAALLILIKNIGLLVFWVLLATMIISWIDYNFNSVRYTLIQMTEPLLFFIRNLLPIKSNIDFASIILMLLLYLLDTIICTLIQLTGNTLLMRVWIQL